MNERIKLLAEQCWDWRLDGRHFDQEKFALLIVKECCQYLNTEAERLYSLGASEHRHNFKEDFEICAEKCYDNIQGLKDHFGVE